MVTILLQALMNTFNWLIIYKNNVPLLNNKQYISKFEKETHVKSVSCVSGLNLLLRRSNKAMGKWTEQDFFWKPGTIVMQNMHRAELLMREAPVAPLVRAHTTWLRLYRMSSALSLPPFLTLYTLSLSKI